MMHMTPGIETKRKIIKAAERLFGTLGYDGASLRAITAEAGVNLAAVNYHFNSKEALVQAVLAEKLRPINERRTAILDELEAAAQGRAVPLPDLVRAFVGPVLSPGGSPSERSVITGLLGRMFYEPTPWATRIFAEQVRETGSRFRNALARALPELDPEELFWRFFFLIGTMAHTMATGHILASLSGGRCNPADTEDAIRRLTSFLVAGLKAPVESRKASKQRSKARN
jgi:AcrR family transcriptional regulator